MPHPCSKEKWKTNGGGTMLEQLHKELLFVHQEWVSSGWLSHTQVRYKLLPTHHWQSGELQLNKHEKTMKLPVHSTCLETMKQHGQVKDSTCKSFKCINQLQTFNIFSRFMQFEDLHSFFLQQTRMSYISIID